ncbi:MATE family efflux transporter [Salinilacihabitans rarus]|uniref:MATE family efflux transporter n=1 Tax=Salinilacihabitans rarus TaxID=2961596 RepID=UPI0020C92AD2|nr:MATE family efflux transporter [Salinilacihabitans rarus]
MTGSSDSEDRSPADVEDSLTEGALGRPLLRLAWPIVVFQLLQVAYNLADTLWLGQLSADAVGAISLAFPLVFLLIAVAGGFTTAGSILVAQYTGAESERSAGLFAGQTIAFVGLLAVVLGAVGYFYTGPALSLLPSDPETAAKVIPLAADYMQVFFLGLPFLFGFYVFEALMRGYGNTVTPMRLMFVSVLINVLIDPFLIFGFADNPLFGWLGLGGLEASLYAATGFTGYGVAGAAVATVFSRGVASIIGFYVLFASEVGPDASLSHLRLNAENVWEITRLGVPTSLEQSANALALVVLTGMVVSFAPPVVAAYGLGNRLISLVFLPALGLSRATETMVGQNLGADRPERAERAVRLSAAAAGGVMIGVAVIAVAFARPVNGIFIGADVEGAAETVALATDYLRIRSVEFAFIGVMQVVLGAFRGAGNTKTAMVFSWLNLWGVRVPGVYVLAFVLGWGATGIWVGMSLGHVVGAFVAVAWFLRGTWKESIVDDARTDAEPVAVDE